MKKILVIPQEVTGKTDLRKVDFYTQDNIQYVEEIQRLLVTKGLDFSKYKYCSLENESDIPIFIDVKDKISNSTMAQFEIEKCKFKDVDADDVSLLIENRYLTKLLQKRYELYQKALDLIIEEKLSGKENEEAYKPLKTEYTKLSKQITSFDYKKYLNEIV